ncbi:MAG: DNA-binding PadR family transcriptional regulator [Myxococcota bacterium]|jgi:DNA-binding PadR family transcriptional regulator
MSMLDGLKKLLLGTSEADLASWKPEDTKGLTTMSDTEALIVQALLIGGESYGQELIRGSEGRLKQGTIYVLLNRMEVKGFIESKTEAQSPDTRRSPRRLYQVAGVGERVFRAKVAAAKAQQLAWGVV